MRMLDYIDQLLCTDYRPFSPMPDLIASGSAGRRVYGFFSHEPGVSGRFHFIHHSDLRDLLQLKFTGMVYPEKLKTAYEWMPSHLRMTHLYPGFEIIESKYITASDLVVSQVKIRPVSGKIKFKLKLGSDLLGESGETSLHLHGQNVQITAFSSDPALFAGKEISLAQNGEYNFAMACAFKVEGEEWPMNIPSLAEYREEYSRFYEGIPELRCSDPDIEKVYYYRWFLLKYHAADPRLGNIRYPICFEGRHGYFFDQSNPGGAWEFSRGILASACHHLLDLRWQADFQLVKGEVLNYALNFGKMEPVFFDYDIPLLPGCIRIHDFKGHYFFHFLPYLVWQIYLAQPDRVWLERVVLGLWEDLQNWAHYDPEDSGLPVMIHEGDSGMEFGPAAHYDPENGRWGPPLANRRTEVTTFYGLNYFGFAKIFEILGEGEKARFCFDKYRRIREALISYCWNDEQKFFLELGTDFTQIKDIKQIGGIFSLLLVDPVDAAGFLDNLTDKNKFNLNYGLATTSKDSFGFSPNNTVDGERLHTCMWNGPVWPYSTSLSLLAVGRLIKQLEDQELQQDYIKFFKDEFRKYTRLHFLYGDQKRPCLVEHYNGETGMPLSAQDDYNHSCYIDIIVRLIAGLDMDEDGEIRFSPLDIGLEYLKLDEIPFRGREYCVEIKGKQACLYSNGSKIGEIAL